MRKGASKRDFIAPPLSELSKSGQKYQLFGCHYVGKELALLQVNSFPRESCPPAAGSRTVPAPIPATGGRRLQYRRIPQRIPPGGASDPGISQCSAGDVREMRCTPPRRPQPQLHARSERACSPSWNPDRRDSAAPAPLETLAAWASRTRIPRDG